MKLAPLKELSTDSVVYGLGSVVTRILGFLLIPVYTHYLTTADYGLLALVSLFGTVVSILIGLGQHSAVFRFYFKHEQAEERRSVLSTFLWIVLAMGLPCLALTAFSRPIARATLGDGSLGLLLVLTIGINYLDLAQKVPLVVVRARRWTLRYSAYTVVRTLVTIALILIFLVVLRGGVQGVLAGQLLSGLIFTLLLFTVLRGEIRFAFSGPVAHDMLRFGLPLLPGHLLALVQESSNRVFLQRLSGVADVGLYALGARFGQVIMLLNAAIQTAWPIFLYGLERDEDAGRLYARAMTYYVAVAGLAWLVVTLFAPEIYALMVHEDYWSSMVVVPIALASYVFLGVHQLGSIGINLREKTVYYIGISAVAAAVSVLANIVLIPRWGIVGAGFATLGAFGVQAALSLWISRRLFPVPYEGRRLLLLVSAYSAIAIAGWTIPWPGDLMASVGKGVLLGVVLPGVLLAAGIFEPEERARIRSFLGRSAVGASGPR